MADDRLAGRAVVLMKHLAAAYATEVLREFGMWPTWPPDAHVELGAIGRVEDDSFRVEGHLSDFGIDVDAQQSDTSTDTVYASDGTVVVSTQTGVTMPVDDLIGLLDADLDIRFERKNGFFVLLTDCAMLQIRNLLDVAESVTRLQAMGRWNDDWHVVTAARVARSGVIAVGRRRGASISLSVAGGIAAGTPSVEPRATFTVNRARSLGLQMVSAGGLTPLVTLRKLASAHPQPVLRRDDVEQPGRPGGTHAILVEVAAAARQA